MNEAADSDYTAETKKYIQTIKTMDINALVKKIWEEVVQKMKL